MINWSQRKRLFVRILLIAIALLIFKFLIPAPANSPQNIQQIRGVWLTHVGNAFLAYTTLTDNAFHQLSRFNFNRIYVDVYNGGTTYAGCKF